MAKKYSVKNEFERIFEWESEETEGECVGLSDGGG